ncbi:reverse transcriptase domain-containing protein [Paraburkholderia aspalathi]|uniref:reverse transcriptase domain-containing protein n=1 Tax=Paraburkholderia aspalathi TaxID=1324617 RepID=UPI0019093352|nr:reverse transcriptase domain-containing protein [Paraburkholderia aspalathi]MBK3843542.1 hypothetical protein [Paraburkholderia aspalathi]
MHVDPGCPDRDWHDAGLTAPFETADGARLPRARGTPQGGVVSPMLMNLFMHYAFDAWMQRHFPQCPFARYADDAVVHCRSMAQAQEVIHAIASRRKRLVWAVMDSELRVWVIWCPPNYGGHQSGQSIEGARSRWRIQATEFPY